MTAIYKNPDGSIGGLVAGGIMKAPTQEEFEACCCGGTCADCCDPMIVTITGFTGDFARWNGVWNLALTNPDQQNPVPDPTPHTLCEWVLSVGVGGAMMVVPSGTGWSFLISSDGFDGGTTDFGSLPCPSGTTVRSLELAYLNIGSQTGTVTIEC